jgi:hypothetical protein
MSAPVNTLDAIEQLRLYFAPLSTRQGILARTALGQPAPDDPALTQQRMGASLAELLRRSGVPMSYSISAVQPTALN